MALPASEGFDNIGSLGAGSPRPVANVGISIQGGSALRHPQREGTVASSSRPTDGDRATRAEPFRMGASFEPPAGAPAASAPPMHEVMMKANEAPAQDVPSWLGLGSGASSEDQSVPPVSTPADLPSTPRSRGVCARRNSPRTSAIDARLTGEINELTSRIRMLENQR